MAGLGEGGGRGSHKVFYKVLCLYRQAVFVYLLAFFFRFSNGPLVFEHLFVLLNVCAFFFLLSHSCLLRACCCDSSEEEGRRCIFRRSPHVMRWDRECKSIGDTAASVDTFFVRTDRFRCERDRVYKPRYLGRMLGNI